MKYIFGLRERSFMDEEKPFLSHLDDLRSTLIKMAVTMVVMICICFPLAPTLLDFLRAPVEKVWIGYERTHLPSEIKAEDWLAAKKLAEALQGLPEKASQALMAQEPQEIKRLTEGVYLLRAMRTLPAKKQGEFLAAAAETPAEIDLVKQLDKSEALLQSGESASGLKMMSSLQPTESFNLSLKLAFFAGVVISFPLLSYFALQFILPGLRDSEKNTLFKAMFVGVGLFLAGVSFAYFVVLPGILEFFFTYSMGMGVANDWRIGFYLTFVIQFVLLFGLSFELPVVVMPFVKLGVLTYDMMRTSRNYAIVIICVLSAVLTPADVLSMVLMAVPMTILYEICIFLAKKEHKRRLKEEEDEASRLEEWERDSSPYEIGSEET